MEKEMLELYQSLSDDDREMVDALILDFARQDSESGHQQSCAVQE